MNTYLSFLTINFLNNLIFKKTQFQVKLYTRLIFIRNEYYFLLCQNYSRFKWTLFKTKVILKKRFFTYKIFKSHSILIFKSLQNNFLIFSINFPTSFARTPLIGMVLNLKKKTTYLRSLYTYKTLFGEGFFYIRGLFIIFLTDALITDDEPLWEPLEWSLIQTWIFFIFIFAWIAENLITSRYGSYTGRDKRVWFAWYKTFWLIEIWYLLTFVAATCFVIVPFYYELTYNVAFIFAWWHWYTKIFFFKFLSVYSIILLIAYLLLINIRWLNWKKLTILILIVNTFLAYLLYSSFITSFFAYFTDPVWYQKTRLVNYIQLSHEPLKWGWGSAKRDHFSYHKTSTTFWFKNDGPFASSFLMLHLFFFLTLFFLYLYWLVLLRRVYVTKEISFTFSTYCISALRQFFFFFSILYFFVFLSFIMSYWRFPIEFVWLINSTSWFIHLFNLIIDLLMFIF